MKSLLSLVALALLGVACGQTETEVFGIRLEEPVTTTTTTLTTTTTITPSSMPFKLPVGVACELEEPFCYGAGYWNDLSGETIFVIDPDGIQATISYNVPAGTAGYADSSYDVATGEIYECEITVHPDYANGWVVFAHELGHCLGLDDKPLDGWTDGSIMDYDSQFLPDPEADAWYWSRQRHLFVEEN